MTIEFRYEGDVSWLTDSERKSLLEELRECTRGQNWDNLEIEEDELLASGRYDDEDGYCTDHEDIERVLGKYEVDWQGGAQESEMEPDWDKMPGGYDYNYAMSLRYND